MQLKKKKLISCNLSKEKIEKKRVLSKTMRQHRDWLKSVLIEFKATGMECVSLNELMEKSGYDRDDKFVFVLSTVIELGYKVIANVQKN